MTSAELKAKMEAAQAKVEKIKKTIERHEKGAEKKLAVLTKNGWLPNPSLYRGASYDAYWRLVSTKASWTTSRQQPGSWQMLKR